MLDLSLLEKQENKTKIIPNLDDNLTDLKVAYNAMEDFDHKSNMEGAKKAFEEHSPSSRGKEISIGRLISKLRILLLSFNLISI